MEGPGFTRPAVLGSEIGALPKRPPFVVEVPVVAADVETSRAGLLSALEVEGCAEEVA